MSNEMKARATSHDRNIHREFDPDLDLVELHRRLAALVNAHIHYDLRGMPEVERQAAMADVLQQIEEELAFKQMPWEAALKEAIQKVDESTPLILMSPSTREG